MRYHRNKYIAIILSLVLSANVFSIPAFAAEEVGTEKQELPTFEITVTEETKDGENVEDEDAEEDVNGETVTTTIETDEQGRVISEHTETTGREEASAAEVKTDEPAETETPIGNLFGSGTEVCGELGETVTVEYGLDADAMLEKPEAPEGFMQADDGGYTKSENGHTQHWRSEEIRDGDRLVGFRTVETDTTETVTEATNANLILPDPDAEGVVISGDGTIYTVTFIEIREDGTKATTVTEIDLSRNMTTTTVTKTATKTTERTVEGESGKITVTFGDAATWSTHGTLHATGVQPDYSEVSPDGSFKNTETDMNNAGAKLDLVDSEKIGRMTSEYNWLFHTAYYEDGYLVYSYHGPQSSVVPGDLSRNEVEQIILFDKDGNPHYAYCVDNSVAFNRNSKWYGLKNVEDVGYIEDDTTLKTVSAIAENGYWGAAEGVGSMEAFTDWLTELGYDGDLSALTPGIAEAVTQAAIWHYGSSETYNYMYSESILPLGEDVTWSYMTGAFDGWYYNREGTSTGGKGWTDEQRTVIDTKLSLADGLYRFVIGKGDEGLLAEKAKESTDLLYADDIANPSVTVKGAADVEGMYETEISFDLLVSYDRLNPDGLRAYVKDSTGTWRFGSITESEDGNTVVTIPNVVLENGNTATVQIKGAQALEQAAYLMEYWSGDYTVTQTLIGVEEGTRDVWMGFNVTLNVDEASVAIKTVESEERQSVAVSEKIWGSEVTITYEYPEEEPEPENPNVEPPEEAKPDEPTPPPSDEPKIPFEPDAPTVPDEPDEPKEPETGIPAEDVPLAELPDIPKGKPQDTPEEIEDTPAMDIPDEDVRLDETPQTGDESRTGLWAAICVLSLFGLVWLIAKRGKNEGDA